MAEKSEDRERSTAEPARQPPDHSTGRRYAALKRAGTAPELALRRELHGRGLRYRIQVPIEGLPRRTVDIAFARDHVAVFVDGCFWHGCPEHGTQPRTNSEWWRWKLERNRTRDDDTNRRLGELGWIVVRLWEHQSPQSAADAVQEALSRARDRS